MTQVIADDLDPSVFEEALLLAQPSITERQLLMLQAHYLAAEQTMSAPDLALAAGVSGYRAVNVQYGRLGSILRSNSGVLSMLSGQRSHAIASFYQPDEEHKHWRLRMHSALTQALDRLAWFSQDLEIANYSELGILVAREGRLSQRLVWHRHRERSLRLAKLKEARTRHPEGRLVCQVPGCSFDFEDVYGQVGGGYAEVHHLEQLAKLESEQLTTLDDLIVICANCHRIVHRGGECRSVEDLVKRQPRA